MELRNFFKKNNSKNTPKNESDFEKKNNKFLKVFGCLALATFMGATALFATAPFGTSAATVAAESETQPTAQENLAAGTLNLNPDTDPTIYTTESGLEIKFGGATVESGGLTGYTYFQMGVYNDEPVNWIIIGYNDSLTVESSIIQQRMDSWYNANGGDVLMNYLFNNNDPASSVIFDEASRGEAIVMHSIIVTITNAVQNTTELDAGEYLCISEKALGSSVFYAYRDGQLSYVRDYNSDLCDLKTYIENLYNEGLNLTETAKALIQPQTLTNYWATTTSTTSDAYLFPLAARGENFNVSTYLTTGTARCIDNVNYWLRSGAEKINDSAHYVYADAGTGAVYTSGVWTSYGVRPAFVIKFE